MKVLASYFLSLSSRPILSNVHRIGLRLSSRISRSICTSNIAFTHSSTSKIFSPLEKIITDNHQLETSKVYNCVTTWTIQNFKLLHGIRIKSEAFSPKDLKYEWFLKLSNGKGNSWRDSTLDLSLKPSAEAIRKFGGASGEIELALIDTDGEKRCVKKKPFIVETTGSEVLIDEFIKQTYLFHEGRDNRPLLEPFLPKGALTIYCQVSFVLIEQIKTIVEDTFSRYFNDTESSDLTIKILWEEYPVHKFVLASRSPVFKEMFERNAGRNHITMGEYIDKEVFLEMLRFIYTGKVEMKNLKYTSSKLDLLLAANKFKIDELKTICEKEILDNMSVKYYNNTAKEIYDFSRKHDLKELETKAERYIRDMNILKKSLKVGFWLAYIAFLIFIMTVIP